MPNEIQLAEQIFSVKEIVDQLPGNTMKKKIFFQAELISLADGNVKFGIIAYPSWNAGKKWELGTKINGRETGNVTRMPFSGPIGFANNELLISPGKKAKRKHKKSKALRKWVKLFNLTCEDQKRLEKATICCQTFISENPHLQYDVILDDGETQVRVRTNPSPPDNIN